MIKRILKLGAILAAIGILLSVVVVLLLVMERSKPVALPAPADSYPVGRLISTWTDDSRQETLGGPAGQQRKLAVWTWYPAENGGASLPYLPTDWANATEGDRGIGALFYQEVNAIHSHATDAPLAARGGPFPVLIMEPGLGPSIPEYTTLAEDLASRGYVVIGLNPTYSSFISIVDGPVIPRSVQGTIPDDATPEQMQQRGDQLIQVWAGDDRFAIDMATRMNANPNDPFVGRLDVHHIGLFGHSFGGASALEACHLDTSCGAAADIDGSPFGDVANAGVDRPVLFIMSEPGNNANSPELQKADRDIATIYRQAPHGYEVTIQGARHFNFTDLAIGYNLLGRPLGILGPIDSARGLNITSEYLAAFFDQTLKARLSPLLQGPSDAFPEAQFSSH